MKFFYVRLTTISDIKLFNMAACQQPFDIDILAGRYIVDAKSIMGILSLDPDKPLRIEVHGTAEDGEAFYKQVEAYVVEGPAAKSAEKQGI